MKQKVIKKETVKTETEELLSQETICENIYNLSAGLSYLAEFDTALLPKDEIDKLVEARINLINSIYLLSTHLTTDENP